MILRKNTLFLFLLCFLSLIMCLVFERGLTVSLGASLSIYLFIIWCSFRVFKFSELPMLAGFFLLIYSLPFINLLEYIYNPTLAFSRFVWAREYTWNLEIINKVGLISAIGAGGLVAGFFASQINKIEKGMHDDNYFCKPLSLPSFMLIAIIAFYLSWINAPGEIITQAAYTTSVARVTAINFNSAWVISYVFIALLMIDSLVDKNFEIRRFKKVVVYCLMIIVVIWLQFMRGKRDCMGLIFAMVLVPIQIEKNLFRKSTKRKIMLAIATFLVIFIIAQYVGAIRCVSVGKKSLSDVMNVETDLSYGTWSGAMLTTISVIGDFHCGAMQQKWGRTYWDMFLSLPPGFLTKWLGIERPLEPTHGPAWEITYGMGGTDVVVVPFMNFKSLGVFFLLFLYGFFIGKVESMVRYPNLWRMLLYSTFFIMGFTWFWYGEISGIRGLMAFILVWATYEILPKEENRTV